MNKSEIWAELKSRFPNVDSWFLICAIGEGETQAAQDKETGRTKRTYGGKTNFKLLKGGKIFKDHWKELRLQPLNMVGEANQTGNRKFNFDIENNKLVFKISRKQHIELQLPLRKVRKQILLKLQEMVNNKELPVSIKITSTEIFIIYDELKLNKVTQVNSNKHAGIDMNPNYVGLSICDGDKIICTKLFKISELTKKSGLPSSHRESKYLNNKLQHETIELAKEISKILVHYKVGLITLEELKFAQGDKKLGRNFNRLVNNVWKRGLFIRQLKKRCQLNGIEFKQVHPAYSSFIGNCMYDFPDPISASLEICRRGKTGIFYPPVKIKDELANQWKKEQDSLVLNLSSWKELFGQIKNLGLKYRVPIQKDGFKKFISTRSQILVD